MEERKKYEDNESKQNSNSSSNVNLLKNKMFKKFIQSRWYPGIFQWPVLIVFAFIVYELLVGPSVAHDNFGTAGTWVLW